MKVCSKIVETQALTSLTQAVFSFLKEHDKLCTWDGLTIAVSKMLCLKKLPKMGKDDYGPLGGLLHRLHISQQLPSFNMHTGSWGQAVVSIEN